MDRVLARLVLAPVLARLLLDRVLARLVLARVLVLGSGSCSRLLILVYVIFVCSRVCSRSHAGSRLSSVSFLKPQLLIYGISVDFIHKIEVLVIAISTLNTIALDTKL